MRTVCSVSTVRHAEAGAGVAEPVLMQRAASALAGVCVDLLRASRGAVRGARVVGLVGPGNNGGDALWALALLAGRGVGCAAVGDPEHMHASGAAAARAAGVAILSWGSAESIDRLEGADLALDGIVGIGGSGGLRPQGARAVGVLRAAGVPVVAVDVPSGVDSDTGAVAGAAVDAAVTVCFGVLKPGLLVAPGRHRCGVVAVADIGLREADLAPVALALDLADLAIPGPAPDDHKYRRGVVRVVAGSAAYPGAALLAVGGARMSGAGMVSFTPPGDAAGLDPVAAMVVATHPDVVIGGGARVHARCVGPGLGTTRPAAEAVLAALAEPEPVVVDASGLAVLGWHEGRRALADRAAQGRVTVLTPHAGEFTRLGFDDSGGPLVAARRAASDTGAVIVLKGPGTVIASPGATYIDTFGGPELATAGSGDVLAGLVGGMLAGAAGEPASAALVAARAVGLHGLAGRLAAGTGGPVTAPDIVAHLGVAMARARAAADA